MITAIFDLDGTIADTLLDLADAVNFGLRELGCPEHPVESYKKMVGNGAQKLCYRALPDDRKELAESLHTLFKSCYSEHYLDNTRLYDGIKDLLVRLSENGVKLAVATNKPQDAARNVVSALLPEINFVKVLGGCDERPKKPDAAIIREILESLPDEENTVYMIGDSNVDIQTAKAAGIIPIGCNWGFRGAEELRSAFGGGFGRRSCRARHVIHSQARSLLPARNIPWLGNATYVDFHFLTAEPPDTASILYT